MAMPERGLEINPRPEDIILFTAEIPKSTTQIDSCMLCGSSVHDHGIEFSYEDDKTVFKYEGKIPGVKCNGCENEFFEGEIQYILYKSFLPLVPLDSKRRVNIEEQFNVLSKLYENKSSQ